MATRSLRDKQESKGSKRKLEEQREQALQETEDEIELDEEQQKSLVQADLERELQALEALGPASRTKAQIAAQKKRAERHRAGRGGNRRPTFEVFRRRQAVELLMREGYSGDELNRRLTELLGKAYPWNTVRTDVRRIQRQWEESDAFERPLLRSRQRKKLYQVARKLERLGEWRDWIRLQELIAKIDGTHTPTKVEHVKTTDFDTWTTEELEHYAKTGEVPARLARGKKADQKSEEKSSGRSGDQSVGRRETTRTEPTIH